MYDLCNHDKLYILILPLSLVAFLFYHLQILPELQVKRIEPSTPFRLIRMTTKPLVSVLIPVYNAGDYLRPSLQSILAQSYSDLEILIINDGSTDNCMDSIADINDSRIRIFDKENGGRSSAMNCGLNEMTGEFYVAHDADDISYPFRIERQVKCLLNAPDIAGVFVGWDLLIGSKVLAPRFAVKDVERCCQDIQNFKMPAIGATPMYRVAMVGDIRFETSLRVAEDYDYILRIGERYSMKVLPDCLYSYRIHACSSTNINPHRNYLMEVKAIERACQRRGLDPMKYLAGKKPLKYRRSSRNSDIGLVSHFMESVLDLRHSGRRWQALTTALACLRLHPFDIYYYKPLLYFVLPMPIIEFYRSNKKTF